MYTDRLPPSDEAAEQAVLGSILIEGDSLSEVSLIIKSSDFYTERNKWIYEACLSLYNRGEPINQISVAHELSSTDKLESIGGEGFLSNLIANVPTSVYASHYAQIINRTSTMRNLIKAATEIASLGYEPDFEVDSAIKQSEDILFQIRETRENRDFRSLRDVLDTYLEESSNDDPDSLTNTQPILTGFRDLDSLLGGLQRSDLFILAARPSIGKSSLALNIAMNACKNNSTVAILSLEMSGEQLAMRMVSSEAKVDAHKVRQNLINSQEQQRIVSAIGTLSDLDLYIDDSPIQTITEIRSKARRLNLERNIDLLIVDYMQLIQGLHRNENRVQEISEISRSLKGIARDLNIPVIAISQLSRAVEQRPSHRPQLSDLRDSGSIEQDADIVSFIYREDVYYTEEEWNSRNPVDPYPKNIAEVIIAKHRNGPLGNINLFFNDQYAEFKDMATREIDN
ncbi:MAG: replicative DNA helicase [SAR202 cluster bacterium]|nr:replicative DNA helicase [Chloroflexota bacterium]MQG51396.1 replicative DNA helicase [SAR202 cluster bacterium]|tara:strand:+ start:12162 stop:13526 length:1365 start_codon:yes stop_codon:yes gene_type:complete